MTMTSDRAHQALEAEQPVERLVVVVDDLDEVVRTAGTAQPALLPSSIASDLEAEPRNDTPHQPAVEPARQPPGGEGEQQVDEADRATRTGPPVPIVYSHAGVASLS